MEEMMDRNEQVRKAVSAALKGLPTHPYKTYDQRAKKHIVKPSRAERARRFARRMREAERRVREEGTRLPGGARPRLPRGVVNVLCFGVGDEHNRKMIERYRQAAMAAERFCR